MKIILFGIIIVIFLFKIYPSNSKNELKTRALQTVFVFVLFVALVISFKYSILLMKFITGAMIGGLAIYFMYRKRKNDRQISQAEDRKLIN